MRKLGWSVHGHDSSAIHRKKNANFFRTSSPQHFHYGLLKSTYRLDRMDSIVQFVRNPINRVVSEFKWRNRGKFAQNNLDAQFELWWKGVRIAYKKDSFLLDNHIRPQSDFLVPGAVIGRFEEDLNARFLEQKLGHLEPLLSEAAMPALNASEVQKVELTKKALRSVRRFYSQDFRRIGYLS